MHKKILRDFIRKYVLVSAAVILAALGFYYWSTNNVYSQVIIGNYKYQVEVALTPSEQRTGLMNRNYLAPDKGMIFVFKLPAIQKFGNENTLIPLDVVWILDDKVVGISLLQEIDKGLQIVESRVPANYVLELSSGSAIRDGIQVGSEVKIRL